MKFNETLQAKILRESVDDEKRTVVAGVLEGDFLSENKRFYPEAIVRKASETLVGKPSMIGHDTNSPRDVVARITASAMSGKKLIASFKFGKDASSDEMFQKVKDGLVDSYSIRAYGETRRGQIDGEDVDIVQEMDIETVDLVVTPGIKSAKVLRVYESAPKVNYSEDKEMTEQEVKQLQSQLDEANKKLKEAETARLLSEQEKKKSEEALLVAELSTQISNDLSTIREEYRESIKGTFVGNTKELWAKHFEAWKKQLDCIIKKANVDESIVIEPKDKKKEVEHLTFESVIYSSDVPKEKKKAVLKAIFN